MLLEEYDNSKTAVFNPSTFFKPIENCPELCISFFSKSIIKEVIRIFNPEIIGTVQNATAVFPVYKINYKGTNIAIYHSPVGAPACVAVFEEMIEFGIKKLLLIGSCGCLDERIEDYSIIIPTSAIRDEGTSYHYLPASDEIELSQNLVSKIERVLNNLKIDYNKGKTWTTDAIYRETKAKVENRKKIGAITVDMECSAMASVARFRNIDFVQMFYAADSLAKDNYNPRSLMNSEISKKSKIIPLALDCILGLLANNK